MQNRRNLLTAVAGLGVGSMALAGSRFGFGGKAAEAAPADHFPLSLSDGEWHKRLTPVEYRVLRQEGTERPFTSPLNDEHRTGVFSCVGCSQKLYESNTKFDSGTGWPSFFRPMSNAVGERTDSTLGMTRTEVHCANCGGHLGHVFDDGPRPTGLRYCMNGVAMKFTAA